MIGDNPFSQITFICIKHLKQYLHFYIQRKARNNRSFHNDGMMMEMISETENTTQQHGPDKHQAYPEQHREI